MTGNVDISKIISLIMENPKLIEEIASLAKGGSEAPNEAEEPLSREDKSVSEEPKEEHELKESVPSSALIRERRHGTKNRSQLLGALKPYVSRERAQAIDSMLSIVEILDVMKGR